MGARGTKGKKKAGGPKIKRAADEGACARPAPPTEAQIRATFEELFFRPARPQQVEFCLNFHASIAEKGSLCAELPTGTGKTLLAFYAAHAARAHGFESALIVAGHQRRLQQQYAEEAARLSEKEFDCFVLYGRDNYACDARLHAALDADEPFALVADEGQREKIARYFGAVYERAQHAANDPRHRDWMRSSLNAWNEFAKAEQVCTEVRDQVWSRVSAKNCSCAEKAQQQQKASGGPLLLSCPRHLSRRHAKKAQIVIANMSYLSTIAAMGMLDTLLLDDNKKRRFVVYDEAHALIEAAQDIYAARSLTPLLLHDVSWACDAFKAERWLRALKLRDVEAALKALQPRDEVLLFETEGDAPARPKAAKEQSKRLKAVRTSVLAAPRELADEVIGLGLSAQNAQQAVEEIAEPFTRVEALAAFRGVRDCSLQDLEEQLHFSLSSLLDEVPAGGGKYNVALAALKSTLLKRNMPSMTAVQSDVWRACERSAGDDFGATLKRLRRVVSGLENARRACFKAPWLDSESFEQAPSLSRDGVRFVLSQREKAKALRETLLFDEFPPTMMSATLCGKSAQRPFGHFEIALDLRFDKQLVVGSPFDPASRVFWRPGGELVRPAKFESMAAEEAWLRKQAALIADTIAKNPRRLTLVISMSKDENGALMAKLKAALPEHAHVPFDEQHRFEELCAAPEQRGVVYGCESLATGVDLPGLVGLVVILKPLGLSCAADEVYARDYLNRASQMWEFYFFKNVYRFRQACGRLVRAHGDGGVILFFDTMSANGFAPRNKELDAVKHFFARPVETTSNPLPVWPR